MVGDLLDPKKILWLLLMAIVFVLSLAVVLGKFSSSHSRMEPAPPSRTLESSSFEFPIRDISAR